MSVRDEAGLVFPPLAGQFYFFIFIPILTVNN